MASEEHPKHPVSEEEKEAEKCKNFLMGLGLKAVVSTTFHPLTFAKVLFQLGHEPYPVSIGKNYGFVGQNKHYLPNIFSYLRNIYRESGLTAIYQGLDANILSSVLSAAATFAVTSYIDKFHPDIGGNLDKLLEKDVSQLTNHESLRITVRQGIRDTISLTAATLVCRPFTVIMIREIAQHVGGESKYTNVFQSLLRIGQEEGPTGLFSGIIPDLIAGYLALWGVTFIRYGAERFLENSFDKNDEAAVKVVKDSRFALQYIIPMIVGTVSYPFNVVSTVMAVHGSGLAISLLPYSPLFSFWQDAYSYLDPAGLKRGGRMFFREQTGPISVGKDHNIYASNKHFI